MAESNDQEKNNIKLKRINIKNFRHMENVSIEFGDYLTIISGLNGTGKSSILGLIGHIFTFGDKTESDSPKTLGGDYFKTEYSKIFRFCPEKDIKNIYEYEVVLTEGENEIIKKAKSRFSETENRFRIDVGERKKEEGKIKYPVIFLGLRRLFPIAEEKDKDIFLKKELVDANDLNFFNRESNEIFVSLNDQINPRHVKTRNKNFFGMETSLYSVLGNSAGQDNVGQILTSIMSFNKLNPPRGILLVDEIDTTLFAGAQINLIKRLYGYARKYHLQIIFTTHSLEIINFLKNQNYEGVKINFLEIKNKKVINTPNPEINYIKSKILMEAKAKSKIERINILCEDKIASLWCKNLLNGSKIKDYFSIFPATSNGVLADIASKKLSCFKNFLFILDGDSKEDKRFKKIKNIFFLPGNRPPENIFYNFLKSLSDEDSFWNGDNFFDKTACFNGFATEENLSGQKRWFENKKEYFGKGNSKLFNKWKNMNPEETREFLDKLTSLVKQNAN
jgi:predicted ATPase